MKCSVPYGIALVCLLQVELGAAEYAFDFNRYAAELKACDPVFDNVQGTGVLEVSRKGQPVSKYEVVFKLADGLCRVDVRVISGDGKPGRGFSYVLGKEAAFAVEETASGDFLLREHQPATVGVRELQSFFTQYFFAPYGPAPNPGSKFLVNLNKKPSYEGPNFRLTGYPVRGEGPLKTHEVTFSNTDASGQPCEGRLKVSEGRGWLLDRLEYTFGQGDKMAYTIDVEYPAQEPSSMLPSRVKYDMFGTVYDFTFKSIDAYKPRPADFRLSAFGLGRLESAPCSGWRFGSGAFFLVAALLMGVAFALRILGRSR